MGTGTTTGGALCAGLTLAGIVAIAQTIKQQRLDRLKRSGIADIDKMDGRQFELYLGHLFKAHGYAVEVTHAVGDYGADLVVRKHGKMIIVQAKRTARPSGSALCRRLIQPLSITNAHEGWVDATATHRSGKDAGAFKRCQTRQSGAIDRLGSEAQSGAAPSAASVTAAAPARRKACKKVRCADGSSEGTEGRVFRLQLVSEVQKHYPA